MRKSIVSHTKTDHTAGIIRNWKMMENGAADETTFQTVGPETMGRPAEFSSLQQHPPRPATLSWCSCTCAAPDNLSHVSIIRQALASAHACIFKVCQTCSKLSIERRQLIRKFQPESVSIELRRNRRTESICSGAPWMATDSSIQPFMVARCSVSPESQSTTVGL